MLQIVKLTLIYDSQIDIDGIDNDNDDNNNNNNNDDDDDDDDDK